VLAALGTAKYWLDISGEPLLAEAVPQLIEHGRRESAARAAILLAHIAWAQGRRDDMDRWMTWIDEQLSDVPDSPAQVEALVRRCGFLMVGGEYVEAIDVARAALERMGELDRPDLRARALDVIGVSRRNLGDEGGYEDQRRAIEIAREGRALWEFHHARNNLISANFSTARFDEVRDELESWRLSWEELGGPRQSWLWYLLARAQYAYVAGDWDGVAHEIARFRAGLPEGQPHYLEPSMALLEAKILTARDHADAARAEINRAMGLSESAADPQTLAPSRVQRALVELDAGNRSLAEADFDWLVGLGDTLVVSLAEETTDFAWLGVGLGRGADAAAVIAASPLPAWSEVGVAIATGEAARALELLTGMGNRSAAAYARLRFGGVHLPAALDFYRSVGAARYVREIEAAIADGSA
jgi:tetratricopeptide (TPR) repeat protein